MTVNAPVRRSLANTELHPSCNVLLIAPRFNGQSFWNFSAACEVHGAKFPAPPLGLITVAALLPSSWECRLVNRNTEELTEAELEWLRPKASWRTAPWRPLRQSSARAPCCNGPVPRGGTDGSQTHCWREMDLNLYGAFPVKRLFWVVVTVFCSERERPFFVPSPAIRFAERAEGVKGPKR